MQVELLQPWQEVLGKFYSFNRDRHIVGQAKPLDFVDLLTFRQGGELLRSRARLLHPEP